MQPVRPGEPDLTRPAKPEIQHADPIKHAWYRPQALPSHFREKILFLSILLHLLFFVVWENSSRLGLFSVTPPPTPVAEPIVLDLQQPPPAPPKRVIESPPDAEIPQPPEKADFLSDRNARARNEKADLSKPVTEDPFNPGDLETHSLPPSPKPAPPAPPVSEPEPKPKPDLLNTDNYVRENFRKQMQEQAQTSERERMGIAHQHLTNRVKDMGGLAFNTYNWDFAPYMLRLKAIIEQNIHPPHAFSHLGIISGVTLLRFKIFPDGTLRDLEILDFTGHKTLMETSASAVQISAPFPDLPRDFPEPYLEVTGKFLYLIKDN
jgi:hypothetical protein